MRRLVLAAAATAFLAACGSGSETTTAGGTVPPTGPTPPPGGTVPPTGPTPPPGGPPTVDLDFVPTASEIAALVTLPADQTYTGFRDRSGGTQIISGVGFYRDATREDPDNRRVFLIGTRDSATDAIIITDMQSVLEDADGTSPVGVLELYNLTDGAVPAGELFLLPSIRQFAAQGVLRNIGSGGDSGDASVIGVATLPSDMPLSGSLTYDEGEARFIYSIVGGGASWDESNPELVVDFATATVDVTAFNDRASTPAQVPVPFDRVEVRGMRIEGNAFAGGTHAILDGTTDVTASILGGAPESSDAVGQFYGPASPMPAEAGVVTVFDGPAETFLSVTTLHAP